MTGRREQLRETQLKSPRTSAQSLNEALKDLQLRLERVERYAFHEVKVISDGSGNVAKVVLPRPAWPVRVVYVGAVYDVTYSTSLLPSTHDIQGWLLTNEGITIPAMNMQRNNNRYAITFEVRG